MNGVRSERMCEVVEANERRYRGSEVGALGEQQLREAFPESGPFRHVLDATVSSAARPAAFIIDTAGRRQRDGAAALDVHCPGGTGVATFKHIPSVTDLHLRSETGNFPALSTPLSRYSEDTDCAVVTPLCYRG
jgi:hypothetical protein